MTSSSSNFFFCVIFPGNFLTRLLCFQEMETLSLSPVFRKETGVLEGQRTQLKLNRWAQNRYSKGGSVRSGKLLTLEYHSAL